MAKYGIIGISGKMGVEINNVLEEEGHRLVFQFDKNISDLKDNPEVIIDFSLPEAFDSTIEFVQKFNSALIIGTTGLTENNVAVLKHLSKNVPVIQSYNFSIGIQMLMRAINIVKNDLKNWDIEITETHHRFKKDKPSGTALMIKEQLNNIKDVPVSSLRLGNVPGEHSIYFGSLGETLTFKHTALSRRTFAEGVAKCLPFILNKKNGYYSFKDVLDNV